MALPRAIADRVYLTTLSLLRHEGQGGAGQLTLQQLARDVFRRYGGVSSEYNYAEYRSIVNQAVAGYEAGADYRAGLPEPAPPRNTTIPADQDRYQYRVVVGLPGPDGRYRERMEVIYSPDPLDADTLTREAISQAQNTSPQDTTTDRLVGRRDSLGAPYAVVITAGGRP